MDNYGFLNDKKKHGFRKGQSCETQLAHTVDDLAGILNNKGQADVIIMDFSKAFDSIPHERLIMKLDHAGINGTLHTWIRSFLTQRT